MIGVSPVELEAELAAGKVRLVDVRESLERWFERIAGAEPAPLSSFDPTAFADRAESVVLYCASGQRSAVAASRLSAASGRPVRHLAGGLHAWKTAGRPVERWGRSKPSAP